MSHDEATHVQRQVILRILPESLLEAIREKLVEGSLSDVQFFFEDPPALSTLQVSPSQKMVFQLGDMIYPGLLVNLPCPVESHKTFDRITTFKSADIGQMLIVFENEGEREKAEKECGVEQRFFHSGLTPPTSYVTRRRFAQTKSELRSFTRKEVSEVEDELLKLMSSTPERHVVSEEEEVVDFYDFMRSAEQPLGIRVTESDRLAYEHPEIFLTGEPRKGPPRSSKRQPLRASAGSEDTPSLASPGKPVFESRSGKMAFGKGSAAVGANPPSNMQELDFGMEVDLSGGKGGGKGAAYGGRGGAGVFSAVGDASGGAAGSGGGAGGGTGGGTTAANKAPGADFGLTLDPESLEDEALGVNFQFDERDMEVLDRIDLGGQDGGAAGDLSGKDGTTVVPPSAPTQPPVAEPVALLQVAPTAPTAPVVAPAVSAAASTPAGKASAPPPSEVPEAPAPMAVDFTQLEASLVQDPEYQAMRSQLANLEKEEQAAQAKVREFEKKMKTVNAIMKKRFAGPLQEAQAQLETVRASVGALRAQVQDRRRAAGLPPDEPGS